MTASTWTGWNCAAELFRYLSGKKRARSAIMNRTEDLKNQTEMVSGIFSSATRNAQGATIYAPRTMGHGSWSTDKALNGSRYRFAARLLGALGIFVFSLSLFFQTPALANGLSISNVMINGWDTTHHTATVQFDITWDNAWRDSTNYDAAWVVIKRGELGTISHCTLAHQGHKSPVGIEIVLPNDYMGAFIQFSGATSSHTLTANGVKLVWDYGKDGVLDGDAKTLGVGVLGIEMVYIPQGAFYAGDGNNELGAFRMGSDDYAPWHITSEEPMTFGDGSGGTYYYVQTFFSTAGEYASGASASVNRSFPKGYQAFYLMKYELTEQQYVDFLNSLPRAAQINRVKTTISGTSCTNKYVMTDTSTVYHRNTIQCDSTAIDAPPALVTFVTDRPDRAASNLAWADLMAVADFIALRPMTELEFEKAARGPTYPVSNEPAWGEVSAVQCTTLSGTEDGTETCSAPSGANSNFTITTFVGGDSDGPGPVRVGMFATDSTATDRVAAGAGYYGSMNLSDNVEERVVCIGTPITANFFTGSHGDGVLTTTTGYEGNATNHDWPGIDLGHFDRGITMADALGSGFKGGGAILSSDPPFDIAMGPVSSRIVACNNMAQRTDPPNLEAGGRLARTAPK